MDLRFELCWVLKLYSKQTIFLKMFYTFADFGIYLPLETYLQREKNAWLASQHNENTLTDVSTHVSPKPVFTNKKILKNGIMMI